MLDIHVFGIAKNVFVNHAQSKTDICIDGFTFKEHYLLKQIYTWCSILFTYCEFVILNMHCFLLYLAIFFLLPRLKFGGVKRKHSFIFYVYYLNFSISFLAFLKDIHTSHFIRIKHHGRNSEWVQYHFI